MKRTVLLAVIIVSFSTGLAVSFLPTNIRSRWISQTDDDVAVTELIIQHPNLSTEIRRVILMDRLAILPSQADRIVEQLQSPAPGSGSITVEDVSPFTALRGDLALRDQLAKSLAVSSHPGEVASISKSLDMLDNAMDARFRRIDRLAAETIAVHDFPLDEKTASAVNESLQFIQDSGRTAEKLRQIMRTKIGDLFLKIEKELGEETTNFGALEKHTTEGPPTGSTQTRECFVAAQRIQSSVNLLADDRLQSWAEFALDAEAFEKLHELETAAGSLVSKVGSLQVLRYNRWALSEVYAAHDDPNWPERLGKIDRSNLHPSVMFLWSAEHERRLQEVQDREVRPQFVRRLLTTPIVPLDAF